MPTSHIEITSHTETTTPTTRTSYHVCTTVPPGVYRALNAEANERGTSMEAFANLALTAMAGKLMAKHGIAQGAPDRPMRTANKVLVGARVPPDVLSALKTRASAGNMSLGDYLTHLTDNLPQQS